MSTSVLERIDTRIRELGTSRRKVSLLAGLGADYIRDLGRKKNGSPGLQAIEKLAPVLETTVDWLRGVEAETMAGGVKPPPAVMGPEDLPLYRSVEGGPGQIVVSERPIKHVARPPVLSNNDEAFAVVVSGESMAPEYESGDMVLVDPWKPLQRDRNFIFVNDQHGDWVACVKRLVSWDAEIYYVLQHNPPPGSEAEFELKRSDWSRAMRVIGKYDRE